ncbi:glycoside hydrolase family protein [Acinetobacter boissieri]|uniref:Lysozyme n=1 Tax=Acinetobacter boissieri TaxID=1219383 RepID=A0A1G6H386_9GAMM|nr:lysozyme [Acinetobacter boissieri]SDB88722.1 hypothetical protein SAMN05421733_103239 [Acinetobacter boissieri]
MLDTAYKGMKQFQTASFTSEDAYSTGTTLVLVQNEGKANELSQFVRITAVSTRTAKMVIDQKEIEYRLTTYSISEALLYDFTGLSARRWYAGDTSVTILRETIVADTGKYYASTDLNENISIGQTTVYAKTIYTQLIPSAQSETPLIDVKASGEDSTLIAANSQTIAVSSNVTISPSQNYYVGSPIFPNSLSFSLFGTQISDKGGVITQGNGSTIKPDGTKIKMTDKPISEKEALNYLKAHMHRHKKTFNASLKNVRLSQVEYDLYADFVYQYGINAWTKSQMLTHLKKGSMCKRVNR